MKRLIVTNNERVIKHYENCFVVEGESEEVLLAVRDLVHKGHALLSYPLGASIKMLYTPSLSVLMTDSAETMDEESAQIIESSIEKLQRIKGIRKSDLRHKKDYEFLDEERLKAALNELSRY